MSNFVILDENIVVPSVKRVKTACQIWCQLMTQWSLFCNKKSH